MYTLLHLRAAAAKKWDVAAPHFLVHVSGCKLNGPLHDISRNVLAARGTNRVYALQSCKTKQNQTLFNGKCIKIFFFLIILIYFLF